MQKLLSHIIKLLHKILIRLRIGEKTRYAIVKYLFNTGWMFVEKILFMAVAFFVSIYVARYLGPDKYGLLSYAFSFVFIFQAIAKLGLDGITTRELVKNQANKNEILGTSLVLKAIGSIISLLFVFISIQLTSGDNETKIMVMIIAVGMLFNTFEVGRFFFESQIKAKFSAIANSIAIIISAGFKIFLIISKSDLKWFAVAYSVEIIVRAIGFIAIYQLKYKDIFKWKFKLKLSKSLLRDSWALMLSSIAVMLFMKIDQVMIKEMLDAEAVGQYAVAAKISEIWYFIPVIINSSLFPAIIQARKNEKNFYTKRLQQLFNLLVWISIAIALPISFLSSFLISITFGGEYFAASAVLSIHIWSGIFIFMNNAVGKWHIVENLTKLSLFRTLSGAIINIILNFILIPKYQIMGATWATLISYAYVGYFSGIFFKSTRELFVIQTNAFFLKSLLLKNK